MQNSVNNNSAQNTEKFEFKEDDPVIKNMPLDGSRMLTKEESDYMDRWEAAKNKKKLQEKNNAEKNSTK